MNLKAGWKLITETIQQWNQDEIGRLAAALSYFTIFSISPLFVIALTVAGLVVSRSEAEQQIIEQVNAWLGGNVDAGLLREMIRAAEIQTSSSLIPTLIGLAVLLFGATNFFFQLEAAMNKVWNAEPDVEKTGLLFFIEKRIMAFIFVLGVGLLLVASLIFNAFLTGLNQFLSEQISGIGRILQTMNWSLSVVILTGVFAVLFRVMPDREIRWRDVWPGAVLTALLFVIGQTVIGFYLGRSSIGSAYGAAGSLAVLLIWIYYTMNIILTGAEFTYVYANHHGALSEI